MIIAISIYLIIGFIIWLTCIFSMSSDMFDDGIVYSVFISFFTIPMLWPFLLLTALAKLFADKRGG